jgi:hypothetical protein
MARVLRRQSTRPHGEARRSENLAHDQRLNPVVLRCRGVLVLRLAFCGSLLACASRASLSFAVRSAAARCSRQYSAVAICAWSAREGLCAVIAPIWGSIAAFPSLPSAAASSAFACSVSDCGLRDFRPDLKEGTAQRFQLRSDPGERLLQIGARRRRIRAPALGSRRMAMAGSLFGRCNIEFTRSRRASFSALPVQGPRPSLIVRGLGRLGRLLGQMIRRSSQTTSDRDRACSEARVDSSGLTRRLRFFGKRPKQTSPYSPDTLRRGHLCRGHWTA